jgi:hypothetical protein
MQSVGQSFFRPRQLYYTKMSIGSQIKFQIKFQQGPRLSSRRSLQGR